MVGYQVTDLVQSDADKRIAEADAKGDEARAEAAKANAEIAKANAEIATAKEQTAILEKATATAKERTATLEKEAAQARLEQEQLKQVVAWRVLSADAGTKLVEVLKQKTALIKLAYVAADPEVLGLAIQFSKVLEAAQWKILPESMTFSSQLIFEIRVPGPENEAVNLLRKALTDAHIPFSTEDVPKPDMSFGHSGPEQPTATLFIGSKRPPF